MFSALNLGGDVERSALDLNMMICTNKLYFQRKWYFLFSKHYPQLYFSGFSESGIKSVAG